MPLPQSELDDPGFVQSVRNGDGAAVSRALDLCLPSLRHVALGRFGLSGDEVEDVLQEVRVAFWRVASRFRGQCSLRTFLTQIACRKCVDHLRERRRHASEPLNDQDIAERNGQSFERAVDRLAVEDALSQLTPRQRQLLDLYYVKRKRYREIASELGITIGTVASVKVEALAKLRSALSEEAVRRARPGR